MRHVCHRRTALVCLVPVVALILSTAAQGQVSSSESELIIAAANAMGGVERIREVRTLRILGYGQEAYQDGGSKITTEGVVVENRRVVANLPGKEIRHDIDSDNDTDLGIGFRLRQRRLGRVDRAAPDLFDLVAVHIVLPPD